MCGKDTMMIGQTVSVIRPGPPIGETINRHNGSSRWGGFSVRKGKIKRERERVPRNAGIVSIN